ncbi:hypothetical protein, partial [Paenibacillus thermotolerans]|uniref:hypothetical protein n=1 Tax=Paenibacillus thermotolerans TaxID=3027807 RepID=UPI002367F0E5
MLLSGFNAIFLFFTLLWGFMGIIELISLIKKANWMKTEYKKGKISSGIFRRGKNRMTYNCLCNKIWSLN